MVSVVKRLVCMAFTISCSLRVCGMGSSGHGLAFENDAGCIIRF